MTVLRLGIKAWRRASVVSKAFETPVCVRWRTKRTPAGAYCKVDVAARQNDRVGRLLDKTAAGGPMKATGLFGLALEERDHGNIPPCIFEGAPVD